MKKYDTAYEAGYEALAAMIIKYAIYDYKKARLSGNLAEVANLQKFFRSEYCHNICKCSGEKMIQMTEELCEETKKKRAERKRKK